MLDDPQLSDPVKEKALRELQLFKETKVKPYVISQAMKSRSSNATIFPVQPGEAAFFTYNFANPYVKPANFDV